MTGVVALASACGGQGWPGARAAEVRAVEEARWRRRATVLPEMRTSSRVLWSTMLKRGRILQTVSLNMHFWYAFDFIRQKALT